MIRRRSGRRRWSHWSTSSCALLAIIQCWDKWPRNGSPLMVHLCSPKTLTITSIIINHKICALNGRCVWVEVLLHLWLPKMCLVSFSEIYGPNAWLAQTALLSVLALLSSALLRRQLSRPRKQIAETLSSAGHVNAASHNTTTTHTIEMLLVNYLVLWIIEKVLWIYWIRSMLIIWPRK